MRRAYRVAVICGATPLLLGVSIFLAWLVTRWPRLALAGFALLYVGLAAVAVGGVALAYFCWVALRTPGVPRRRVWASALGCAALLLANFVVAAAIVWAVIAIETRYIVFVRNASRAQLNDVRVFGGGCDWAFGAVDAGATERRSCWIGHDDGMNFRATIKDRTIEEPIDGYVTNNMGGHVVVTVTPDLKIGVTHQAAHQLGFRDRIRDVLFWLE